MAIKILTIGPSEAGKSTHIIATYGLIKKGITIKSHRFLGKGELSFSYDDKLDKLYASYESNTRYSTSEIKSFETRLKWKNSSIATVYFYDSPGGYLDRERDSREFKSLEEKFKSANYVNIYFEASKLLKPDFYSDIGRSIANLAYLINQRNNITRDKSVSKMLISIIITKCDEIGGLYNVKLKRGVIESLLKPLLIDGRNTKTMVFYITTIPGNEMGTIAPFAAIFATEFTKKLELLTWGLSRQRKMCAKALCNYLSNVDYPWIDSYYWTELRKSI